MIHHNNPSLTLSFPQYCSWSIANALVNTDREIVIDATKGIDHFSSPEPLLSPGPGSDLTLTGQEGRYVVQCYRIPFRSAYGTLRRLAFGGSYHRYQSMYSQVYVYKV